MKRKILIGVVVGAMCLSLAACGNNNKVDKNSKDVVESNVDMELPEGGTSDSKNNKSDSESGAALAVELIDGIDKDAHKGEVMNSTITMDVVLSAEVYDGKKDVETEFSVQGNIEVTGDDKVSHMQGTMVIDGMDMHEEQNMEAWSSYDEDGKKSMYELNDGDGKWYKTVTTGESYESDYTSSLKSDIFSDLTVSETDTEFIVTGYATPKDIDDSIVESFGEDMASVDNSKMVLVTMVFDKTTREYKVVKFDFTDAMNGMNGMEVKSFVLEITINGYTNGGLVVPADIISEAVDTQGFNDSIDSTESDATYESNESGRGDGSTKDASSEENAE